MKKLLSLFTTVLTGSTVLFCSDAYPCPNPVAGDRNGDGYSDLSVAVINRTTKETTFLTTQSPNFPARASRTRFVFNTAFDALVPADYDGDCKLDYAGVKVLSDSTLEWSTELSGTITKEIFGENGSEPHAGNIEDSISDPDQRADKVLVRPCAAPNDEELCWSARLSTGTEVTDLRFGMVGDNAFLGDSDGDGVLELFVVRLSENLLTFYSRPINSSTVTTVQWGERGDTAIPPFDIDGDDLPDYIAIRSSSSSLEAIVRTGPATSLTVPLFGRSSQPVTGKFRADGGRFAAYEPNKARFGIIRGDGTSYNASAGNRSLTVYVIPPVGEAIAPGTTFAEGGTGILGCDRFGQWGVGDTWKPSDTRSCRGFVNPFPAIGKNFTPGISDRRGVANIVPALEYAARTSKVELIDYDGTIITRGVPRPGTPNGRYTVDFCPGPREVQRRYGDVVMKLTFKDGTTECKKLDRPNTTIRNGKTEPNRKR